MRPRLPEGHVFVGKLHPATTAHVIDLGLVDYKEVYELQVRLVEQRRQAALPHDTFLITEHPATFTLGRRGGRENLMVSEQFLQENNIPIIPIERGGDITYHGPGQLVLYPILHLRDALLSVKDYVSLLEEVMLELAAFCLVTAKRDPRNHGIWVGDSKLGSIGIAIRHGISFHGMAINVNNSLEPFGWVNPCGLAGIRMTSLSEQLGEEVDIKDLKDKLISLLPHYFKRDFVQVLKDGLDVAVY